MHGLKGKNVSSMEDKKLPDTDEALTERLVAIAQEARKRIAEGELAKLHDYLTQIRAGADSASGHRLALLEVGEAFLRIMICVDERPGALAIRRMFEEEPEKAERFYSHLMTGGVSEEMVDHLNAISEALSWTGDRYVLRSSYQALVRELLEPAVLRMWGRVEVTREACEDSTDATWFAGQLGITRAQAETHLRAHPLEHE